MDLPVRDALTGHLKLGYEVSFVNCGCGGMVNASALGADEYHSAIAFLVQRNVLKSERWVIAFKGDPTLFLFSGDICPTPVPLPA